MNVDPRLLSSLAAIGAVVSLTACGAAAQASGPYETAVAVGAREYATIPPVSAPATTAPPVPPQPGEVTSIEVVHVVAAGESLGFIAQTYSIGLEELLATNSFESADVRIEPGDTIVIPVGATMPDLAAPPVDNAETGGATANADNETGNQTGDNSADGNQAAEDGTDGEATDTSGDADGCIYTILASDNGPWEVAKKVGVPYEDLVAANDSSGVLDNFLIGDKLVVPAPGTC